MRRSGVRSPSAPPAYALRGFGWQASLRNIHMRRKGQLGRRLPVVARRAKTGAATVDASLICPLQKATARRSAPRNRDDAVRQRAAASLVAAERLDPSANA